MKENNIERSILSISSPGVYLNVPSKTATQQAISLARKVNKYGSEVKAKYPKEFGFFASLPLPDIQASLKEIQYSFGELDPKPDGVVMMSNYYGLYLGDRDLEPIYEALNELNVTIFEHPTTPCTQFNGMRFDIDKDAPTISQQQWQALNRPLAVRQFAAPTLDFPFETARTFADLFYTSMPTKFPNLKWIMSHAGGGLIPTLDRIITYSALYPGLNLTEESMKETLSTNFFFDLAGPWPVNFAIPSLLRWVDYTRIVWGSDTVFTPMDTAAKYAAAFDQEVDNVFNDPVKANAVRADNARKLFN
jgi:predicted TIM-barrel fold metal-dependent hydrolase